MLLTKKNCWKKLFGWQLLAVSSMLLVWTQSAQAQLFITEDTTQDGGTLIIDPAGGLFVGHENNNPLLTLTNGAAANFANGLEAVVVGSLSGESGRLSIDNGSTLSSDGASSESLGTFGSHNVVGGRAYIGLNFGSSGQVTVSGSDSTWFSDVLSIGFSGSGTLSIADGGMVSSSVSASIADNTFSSSGVVTVNGSGSHLSVGSSLSVGRRGTGMLTISDAGTVTNADAWIGRSGSLADGQVVVSGNDSMWENLGELTVGGSGSGSLSIHDGGTVASTQGWVGRSVQGSGQVDVTGSASQWKISGGLLRVGYSGHGELAISNGGAVVVSSGSGSIADNTGSIGHVTVSGNGSHLTITGNLLRVGNWGSGTLSITDGGLVSNTNASIGSNSLGDGQAIVSGFDSQWINSSSLSVGFNSSGQLVITDGGLVSNTEGRIGFNGGVNGQVTVSGSGSQWTNSGQLTVGNSGTATLTIADGGAVSNTTGYIGRLDGSIGTVHVSGTSSSWTNHTDLILGGNTINAALGGSGLLTIAEGGVVMVAGTTRVHGNNPSTISLQSGGKLVTHHFDATGGNFDFSGGTLEMTGGTFTGDLDVVAGATLTGTGSLNGSLTLGGNLAPGNSPGMLHVGGNLIWDGDGMINFELGESLSDLIAINGDLLQGAPGVWNFHFSDAGDFAPGSYTLMTFSSTDFSSHDFGFTSGIAGFSGEFILSGSSLKFSAIPEPASIAMVGLSLLVLTARRRR